MTSIAQIIAAVIDLTEHSRVDLVILESKDELGDDSKDVVIAQSHDKYLY